jgi:hypothetical protein
MRGVTLVHKYDQEFPRKYFKDFLEYIDIAEDVFAQTVDKFRSPHLWHKVYGQVGTAAHGNLRHMAGVHS